ncbi:MAG: 16S rRNA (cytidine1402-2'-O)-methyltransferase, partial [Lysobacterales bacterium]
MLYIVSTPIGNLKDITYRAVEVLKAVDIIAAEDTRHSKKLLNAYDIDTPLTSYFDHSKKSKLDAIINK